MLPGSTITNSTCDFLLPGSTITNSTCYLLLPGSKKQQSDEQVRKVKGEYEKKLTTMQTELNKVNAAKKEHAKMMKNRAVYDRRIKELSTELNDMKKIKV